MPFPMGPVIRRASYDYSCDDCDRTIEAGEDYSYVHHRGHQPDGHICGDCVDRHRDAVIAEFDA